MIVLLFWISRLIVVVMTVVKHPSDSVAIFITEEFLITKPLPTPIIATKNGLLFLKWHIVLFYELSLSDNIH